LFSVTYVKSRSCGKQARCSHDPEVGGSNPPPLLRRSHRDRQLCLALFFAQRGLEQKCSNFCCSLTPREWAVGTTERSFAMASIYKRGPIWWIHYLVGGKSVSRSLRTSNERVALEKKRRLEALEVTGQLRKPSNTPFDDFRQSFCEFLCRIRTRKSAKNDISYLRMFFGPRCPALQPGSTVNHRFRNGEPIVPKVTQEAYDRAVPARHLEERKHRFRSRSCRRFPCGTPGCCRGTVEPGKATWERVIVAAREHSRLKSYRGNAILIFEQPCDTVRHGQTRSVLGSSMRCAGLTPFCLSF